MAIRRRVISQGARESNVYIPNLRMAHLEFTDIGHYVGATYNASRVCFSGTGIQAGQYTTRNDSDAEYRLPVIKLPRNTVSITVSVADTTRLFNASNSITILWMTDTYAGNYLPSTVAYYVSRESYNAKANNDELKINTLNVPSDVDSFVGYFRISPAIGDGETPYTISDDVGFSITFNKA